MRNDSTVYVGLDLHKDPLTVAYAINAGEVELLGKIGTTSADIDRLCTRLQSKAPHVRVVYEAGPCGYGLYRRSYRRASTAWSARRQQAGRTREDRPA